MRVYFDANVFDHIAKGYVPAVQFPLARFSAAY
jgi:hypothetical protein